MGCEAVRIVRSTQSYKALCQTSIMDKKLSVSIDKLKIQNKYIKNRGKE